MDGNGIIIEINGKGVVIGFDHHLLSDKPWRRRVRVGIEVNGEITVNFDNGAVATIGQELRQRVHGVGLESIDGTMPRGVVQS
jgi:hypothetical protein